MLYDGLITALERAQVALESGDVATSHQQLVKAQEIIREGLWGPLDMQYEISKSLASLYEYFHRRLVEANLKKDAAPVVEVLEHVRGLRETWVQAAAKSRQEQEDGADGAAPTATGADAVWQR